MKAILEFNLPDESEEHLLAVHAAETNQVVSSVLELTRVWLKHGHSFNTPNEVIENVRDMLLEAKFQ